MTALATDKLNRLLPGSDPSPILRRLEVSYLARKQAAKAIWAGFSTEDNAEVRRAMREVADELTVQADAAYDAFVAELGGDVIGWAHER